jgi:YD repeat-containing protein
VDGRTWSYDFKGIHYAGDLESSSAMRATDPTGAITSLDMPLWRDPPARIADPLGRATLFSFYRYPWSAIVKGGWPDPDTMIRANWALAYPATVTFPEDAGANVKSIEFTYDDRGNRLIARRNPKAGSGLAPITWAASSPACGNLKVCNKPLIVTDPQGATTVYSYDAAHGGIVSEMKPAPTSGAPRPLKLNSYIQKYAYVLTGGGGLAPAGAPIWVKASTTLCQTAAGSDTPTCDGGAPQTVMTFEFGADGTADNMLVHGISVTSDGQTLRTCYRYDGQGNKISMTKPRAGLSSCQ